MRETSCQFPGLSRKNVTKSSDASVMSVVPQLRFDAVQSSDVLLSATRIKMICPGWPLVKFVIAVGTPLFVFQCTPPLTSGVAPVITCSEPRLTTPSKKVSPSTPRSSSTYRSSPPLMANPAAVMFSATVPSTPTERLLLMARWFAALVVMVGMASTAPSRSSVNCALFVPSFPLNVIMSSAWFEIVSVFPSLKSASQLFPILTAYSCPSELFPFVAEPAVTPERLATMRP